MFLVFWSRNIWLWLSEFVSAPLMMLWRFSNLIRRPPGPLSSRRIWLCALMRVCLCQISTVYTHTCARERIRENLPTASSQLDAHRVRESLNSWADLLRGRFERLSHTPLHFFLWVSNGLRVDVFPEQLRSTLTSRQKICFRLLSLPSGLQSSWC